MASSGNFATINVLGQSLISTITPTLGNLKFDGSTLSPGNYEGGIVCNFGMKSGKWYWETYLSGGGSPVSGRDWNVGFAPYSTVSKSVDEGTYGNFLGNGSSSTLSGYGYTQYPSGTMGVRHNNSTSAFGSAHSSGDVLGHALDLDNGTWIIYKNGSSLGTAATGIDTSFTYFAAGGANGGNIGSFDVTFNFGQDSTFGGALSAGGNSDGNGFGDFKYSVPSGYLACSTANLSISDDIDPAQTDDDFPQKQFNTVLFDGNGSTNAVTGLGFQPDLIWGFTRSGSQSKRVIDSTRGGASRIYSDLQDAADTSQTAISAFGSDGFTANSGYFNNDNGKTCGAWCWRANGGTTASNSSGSITSTVQSSTSGGFSIITYSGNGSSGATIGHGLSSKPEWIIVKNLSDSGGTSHWTLYHVSPGATEYTTFTASAFTANSGFWNNTEPTSTLITLGNNNRVNGSGKNYVCYAWHGVEGYSKFSSFTGNGNSDGAFIYTGFRPRFIFIKKDSTTSWHVFDTARNTFNPVNTYQLWDTSGTDDTADSNAIDFLSNGFKLRNLATGLNANGSTYYYGCYGDVPFKYNNTF